MNPEGIFKNLPHRPAHFEASNTIYMITAGTLHKEKILKTNTHLKIVNEQIILLSDKYDWQLQAWCVLHNHYHIIAISPKTPNLVKFIRHLHSYSSNLLNKLDKTPKRKIWYQYWDSCITYPESYYARLNYVNNNAAKHEIVNNSLDYEFCSATWFNQNADKQFYKMVSNFKYNNISVRDDF